MFPFMNFLFHKDGVLQVRNEEKAKRMLGPDVDLVRQLKHLFPIFYVYLLNP